MISKFQAKFKLGNAEFSEPEHVALALRELADKLEAGQLRGRVLDINGNEVVEFEAEQASRLTAGWSRCTIDS